MWPYPSVSVTKAALQGLSILPHPPLAPPSHQHFHHPCLPRHPLSQLSCEAFGLILSARSPHLPHY